MINSHKHPVLCWICLLHPFIFPRPHLSLILATAAASRALCGFWSVSYNVQPKGLASPQCLYLSIPGFSADTEAGTPTTHLVFMHAQPQRAGGLTNCGEKPGPTVAGSQWVNASSFLSLDRMFQIICHTASQAFRRIQQPITIVGACFTTHYLFSGSPSFPVSLHLAPTPAPWLPLANKTLALKLQSQALLSGESRLRGHSLRHLLD